LKHFLTRNFSLIHGAGGGKKQDRPDPPPPATLLPPKLGKLRSLSSYSYSESIDMLGEGPIEGLVNQNGEIVDGYRIFESIYIDDVPVKKTINPFDESIEKASVSLENLAAAISNVWKNESGETIDKSLSSLSLQDGSYQSDRNVSDPYKFHFVDSGNISAEIVSGKTNIAKCILRGINDLKRVSVDKKQDSTCKSISRQKLLRFDGYSTFSSIETSLLKDFPSSTDYPFFCIKINLGDFYSQSSRPVQDAGEFGVNKFCSAYLDSDISSYVFEKLEISEIGKRRVLRPLRWLDMSYLSLGASTSDVKICGSIYIFGVQENGYPTHETVEAISSNVKNFYMIDFSSEKYNYYNILAEIKNGEELQSSLGFFDKTYLDKNYGIKLLGPFSTQGQTPRIKNFAPKIPKNGVIDIFPSPFEYTSFQEGAYISEEDRNFLAEEWNLQEFLLKNGKFYKAARNYRNRGLRKLKQVYLNDNGNFQVEVLWPKKRKDGAIKLSENEFLTTKPDTFYKFIFTKTGDVFTRSLKKYEYKSEIQMAFDRQSNPFEENVSDEKITDVTYKIDSFKKQIAASLIAVGDFEGSNDTRGGKSYSNWSAGSYSQFDEEPNAVTHVIKNPNVSSVYVTMGVRVLSDTVEKTKDIKGIGENIDAGTRIPTLVKFRIEMGLQDLNGVERDPTEILDFQITGLTESPVLIDIGRTENANSLASYSRFIQGPDNVASALAIPQSTDGSFRYIRVTRLTPETYSSLIRREISLEKVTEIINAKFSYPNSAIVGVKLDSRTLSSLPPRSYDARLKRILVPSNYYPLRTNGTDKRLYKTTSEFIAAPESDKIIYNGEWDGTFKEAWSDNPVWIVFDLLTNKRYGLGNFIEASDVNVWELYKIGRFCDAVNDDGVFTGVPSATGGLEPRYSCNIIIGDNVNVFDAIQNISAAFRGNVFYSNSYIDFTDDRVKLPKAFFNNQNVREGIFNYTNSRRDEQYNTLEVNYFDRDDSFKAKVEYIEDSEDIKKRGVLRTEIDTYGITSRAHANRIGKHVIYSTVNENQAVSFVCGPEILSCKPGDLISVEDDLKSLQKNIGRVLDIDYSNRILRVDDSFDSAKFFNEVSLFIPTGQNTYADYYNRAVSPSKLSMNYLYANDVPQIATFSITGHENLSFGSKLYLNATGENIALLDKAKIGGIYSVTLSGLQQEIYKLTTVKESSSVEYEVAAIKFDTGKFGQIESGQSLVDFYNNYPNVTSPTQGSETIRQSFLYQLGYPVINSVTTGNYDQQADSIDISGSWQAASNATSYDYELITPKFNSITGRTTGNHAVFTDQTQAGRFVFKVSARNEESIPNPIGPTNSSGIVVLSYSAPIRNNSIFAGIKIKQ